MISASSSYATQALFLPPCSLAGSTCGASACLPGVAVHLGARDKQNNILAHAAMMYMAYNERKTHSCHALCFFAVTDNMLSYIFRMLFNAAGSRKKEKNFQSIPDLSLGVGTRKKAGTAAHWAGNKQLACAYFSFSCTPLLHTAAFWHAVLAA